MFSVDFILASADATVFPPDFMLASTDATTFSPDFILASTDATIFPGDFILASADANIFPLADIKKAAADVSTAAMVYKIIASDASAKLSNPLEMRFLPPPPPQNARSLWQSGFQRSGGRAANRLYVRE
jgi:hypothetical protein